MNPSSVEWLSTLSDLLRLGACTKSGIEVTQPTTTEEISVVGVWKVVNMETSFKRIGSTASFKSSYKGVPGDYFDFKDDGNVDIKLGNKRGLMTYRLCDRNIVLTLNGMLNDTFAISKFDGTELLLTSASTTGEEAIIKSKRFRK